MLTKRILWWGLSGLVIVLIFFSLIYLKNRFIKKIPNDSAKNSHENKAWLISPYPDGHNFAFTIVHDADNAYSKRLEPLFSVFDKLGFKITATVFVKRASVEFEAANRKYLESFDKKNQSFWGFRNVPLNEETEKDFYKKISARGHEIGMHTPSATSDTRETIIQSFESFKGVFGSYPKIYVDHWGKGNKETQGNEGANPKSPYYCTDLLNRYKCWVWIIPKGLTNQHDERFFDVIAVNGSPFNNSAFSKYGIIKGFLRTGKWRHGDGDGFLEWYTRKNIDILERERGLAIVYTHLDRKWLDKKTKKMRKEIRDRLNYLAAKSGWFIPAGQILDRFELMKNIFLSYNNKDKWLKIINTNSIPVKKITLISKNNQWLKQRNGKILKTNEDKEIVLETISPYQTASFSIITTETSN